MASMITYAPYLIGSEKKSELGPSTEMRRIGRQIDTLQRMAMKQQTDRWGENWSQEMVDFLNLEYSPQSASPSYRPRVVLPELQFLLMSEATELTNDSPKTYISVNGKKDEAREKAFSAAWKQGLFNNRMFDAVLWSQFCNPAVLQLGFNADARGGKGAVWLRARDPDSFFPDAHAKNDRDWSYVIAEDWFYPDEIRRNWPEVGKYIKTVGYNDDNTEDETGGGNLDLSMELPDGPLRVDSPDGFEHRRNGPRLRVRYLWIKDYSRQRVEEIAGRKTAEGLELLVQPAFKWKYPQGRFITECQGWILADGPNFVPRLPDDDFGTFPFMGVWSMPHPKHYFGVPPVRYGRGPQDIAERMYTQLIENVIRVNNGVTYIPEESGIDVDAFGGLPGEVQVYRGDKSPETKWPNALPQHMTQLPEMLLQKVGRYIGSTPERQGQAGAGNISTDLFDAALFQSQSILRMKARFLSETYHRLTQMAFHMMVRFKTIEDRLKPARKEGEPATIWTPLPEGAEVDLELDETSVDALSGQMMKNLVIALGKTGMVPNKFVLETLGVPNADQIADDAMRQMELAALAKLKRPR